MKKIYKKITSQNFIPYFFKLLFSIAVITCCSDASYAQWTRKADGLRKRGECSSVIYNGKVYIFGGFGEHPEIDSSNEVYNPVLDQWSFIDSFPLNRRVTHMGTVLVDDKVWLIGGRATDNRGLVTSQVLIYDITNNQWSDGPRLEDPATGANLRWAAGGAVLLGRTIHIFGGLVDTFCNGDQNKYHLTLEVDKWAVDPVNNKWKNDLAPMPFGRNHLNATVLNGLIYAIGGQVGHDCGGGKEVSYVQTYDPVTNVWTRLNDMLAPRSHAEGATFAMDGKIYIFGGQNASGNGYNVPLLFDPAANGGAGVWSKPPYNLPYNYLGMSAKYLNNQFIISHGSVLSIEDERKQTYIATVTRNIPYKLGFVGTCLNKTLPGGNIAVLKNWLYSIEGGVSYTLASNMPWVTISKNAAGSVNKQGAEIEVTVNTSGLADGSYTATITATPGSNTPAFTGASFCVNVIVTSSAYSLSVTTNGNGSVTKSPDQSSYLPGTNITLSAQPATGQVFTGWTGDTTSQSNPLQYKMGFSNKTITANFSNEIIKNVSATSGQSYIVSRMAPGALEYTDRTYLVTDVPPFLNNTSFIRTANSDKSNTSSDLLSFDLVKDAILYIAYDPRATSLPAWLNGWLKIPQTLGIDDSKISHLDLYKKIVSAGRITLGGNMQSPAAGAQTGYLVIAQENTAAPVQYTLNITSTGSGTVAKSPDQPTYNSGIDVTLTASPAVGYQFTGWSGDISSMSNPVVVTMSSNKSISATFSPSSTNYTLTTTVSGSGSIARNPDLTSYSPGSSVVLSAAPSAGFQFSGWSGDTTAASNPLTVVMNLSKSLTATFVPATVNYTLSLSVSGNGTVSKSPDQTSYSSGSSVTITASPSAGQQFTGWTGDATGNTNPLVVTMGANKIITAAFAPISSQPLVSNLSVNSSASYLLGQLATDVKYYSDRNYIITAVPSGLNNEILISTANNDKKKTAANLINFNVNQNAVVYIAYDPRESSLPAWLSGWTKVSETIGISDPQISYMELFSKKFPVGNVSLGGNLMSPAAGAQNNYFVVVKADVPPAQYSLTVSTTGSGNVVKNPDQPTYSDGVTVILQASANSGFQFAGWSGDASGTQNPLSVVINANKSINATFIPVSNNPKIQFTGTIDSIKVDQGGSQALLEYLATSNNQPITVKLSAIDESGYTPSWISVNGQALDNLNYTTGSEITFAFDATNLSVGHYPVTVIATSNNYVSDTLLIVLSVQAGSAGTLSNFQINFQDSVTNTPNGWLRDYGQAFGQRLSASQGTGSVYGWVSRANRTPLNLTKNTRNRNTPSNVLLATFIHMQANNTTITSLTQIEGIWEIQVTNGNYDVTVSVGDGSYTDSKHTINVEGVNAIASFTPTSSQKFKSATVTVTVADGLLTIDAIGGNNTKINSINIVPATGSRPSVVAVNPDNGAQQVSENTSISTSILNLPNGGINNATITPNNVYLTELVTGSVVVANVNGTGGGDAITLVPASLLKLNTTYTFTITNGVKDLSGASFISYSSTFTTGTGSSGAILNAKFDKVDLPNATGRHSTLTIGPDKKLYALSIDGMIKRFVINPDGTLGTPDTLYSLQDAYGARTERLAIGLTFDPSSTATNLIAYVTHSTFVFQNGPPWDGKLTRLKGNNLQTVQDLVINLPRSAKDHLTNSVAFGPDGKLYITQGSMSAMGRADQTWGNREERVLSGAVLRLDLSKLGVLPLNVLTSEGGGTYNPFATNAPLTIYASGVRNAYDLLWHSNGNLYTPTNGSAAGGNTPASVSGAPRPDGSSYNGPAIPALSNVQQTQKDFLFRVVKGGYYGHPNPLRGEFVLNGGNPTSYVDAAQVNAYPVGTLPDANYRGYAFDFQNNKSPNGVIEYKNSAFNGALKGKILVVRYSQNDDIITLTPGGANNDIVGSIDGAYVEGFSGFVDPLDLTEDTLTGNIYVSEYGGDGKIVLLRVRPSSPATIAQKTAVNPAQNMIYTSADKLDSLLLTGTPKVFPNPFHQKFNIDFPSSYEGKYTLQLSDISGKIFNLGTTALTKGGSKMELNLGKYNITKGMYFLRIRSAAGKVVVIKIISE